MATESGNCIIDRWWFLGSEAIECSADTGAVTADADAVVVANWQFRIFKCAFNSTLIPLVNHSHSTLVVFLYQK